MPITLFKTDKLLDMLNIHQLSSTNQSLVVEAYLYDRQYEEDLASKLEAFSSVLDLVAGKIQAEHQSRILTKIEHNSLVKSQLALKLGKAFKLDRNSSKVVAEAHLIYGARKVLKLVGVNSEKTLSEYGFGPLDEFQKFIDWPSAQNLIDFRNQQSSQELNERILYYLCQLIVFTFTPKDPSESPDSLIVSPETFFNLSNIWASKPELYEVNLALSASGKKILYRDNESATPGFRTELGRLADLHLETANRFWELCQPIKIWIAD